MKVDHESSAVAAVASIATRGPIADSMDQIFEPIRFETLGDLFSRYRADRQRMTDIAAIFDGSNAALLRHFAAANIDKSSYVSTERLFTLEPALKALDADYWQQALALTDVLESMPQKRRSEWGDLVREHKTPPFVEATVASTLQDLLVQRHMFFAERVDGIFSALSRSHLTNRPEGFGKRMIIANVASGFFVDHNRCGYVNDLRCVIAKFIGREDPRYYDTSRAIEYAQRSRCGEWVPIDGGSLRIRVYLNGNAHLEVHPEMAWRLNSVLASIHPNAIPQEHRHRPSRKPAKDFPFFSRPLPLPVLHLLAEGRMQQGENIFSLSYDAKKHPGYRDACDVLVMLGGVQKCDTFTFDYPPERVIKEVEISGMIPDQRSHQYYPTPRELAVRVVDAAQIGPGHTVLEPSAGQGALAELLPMAQTTVVEVAELHCNVLRAKGFAPIMANFLRWAPGRRFDRVVMNPPFIDSQWRLHLEHAADLVAAGGRIVAVLPVGARLRRDLLSGWACTWSDPEPFPGTSIEVVVLTADRRI